jgi:AGZA family xanthine/uracil permease-like MFS transporter
MGKSWQFALTAVLIEGIIFILLSLVKAREAIFDSIPMNLKHAVSVGIGLFIAIIGLSGAGIVVPGNGTVLALGDLTSGPVAVALFGILVTGVLLAKNVSGAILIGIIASTLIGIPLGVTMIPEGFSILSPPPSLAPVAFKFVGMEEILSMEMLVVVFTFLFVDIFDTVGTLAGVSSKAGFLDKDGKLPRVGKALMADAVGTVAGACLGTSTVTTYVESAAGVAGGGRTGLTSLATAGMFALALFFAPLFTMIPAAATGPALVIVGLFMMSPIKKIDFEDFTEAIPAFLTIVMMPFAYSIADGIVFGMVSYVILKALTGRTKEISKVMWLLAVLFVLKFVLM